VEVIQDYAKLSNAKRSSDAHALSLDEGTRELVESIEIASSAQGITEEQLDIAALFVLDGIHGRPIGYKVDTAWARKCYRLYHAHWWHLIVYLLCALHLSIAFFESPKQFYGKYLAHPMASISDSPLFPDSDTDSNIDTKSRFQQADTLSRLALDHSSIRWLLVGIESCCTAFFWVDFAVLRETQARSGKYAWYRVRPWEMVRVGVLLMLSADILAYCISGGTTTRVSRLCRPMLTIVRIRYLRYTCGNCLRTLPKVVLANSIIAFCVVFWGFLGYLLYDLSNPTYFGSLPTSLYTMTMVFLSIPYMQVCSVRYGVCDMVCMECAVWSVRYGVYGVCCMVCVECAVCSVLYGVYGVCGMQCAVWSVMYGVYGVYTNAHPYTQLAMLGFGTDPTDLSRAGAETAGAPFFFCSYILLTNIVLLKVSELPLSPPSPPSLPPPPLFPPSLLLSTPSLS
jgi:hypothetical protein